MPIHNWSRVSDGMFHWFHQTWIFAIADWLGEGRLPEGFYAIGEVYADDKFSERREFDKQEAETESYVEPIAVGEALPAMPLFLWSDRYINVEPEQTYQSAWNVYPAPLKPKVEGLGTAV